MSHIYLEYRELPSLSSPPKFKLKESSPLSISASFLAMHKGTIKRSSLDLPSTCITHNHNNNNKQTPLSPHLIPILPICFHVNPNNSPINPQSAFTDPSPTYS